MTRPAPSNRARASVALVLGMAIAVTAITTWHALGPYFRAFNTPHTALEAIPHAPSRLPPTPGLARRIVVVIVDGVSFEAAREFSEFGALRRGGVLRPLRAEFPTFTSPALTAMVTGLSPRDSGTRINGGINGVHGLASVLGNAAAAGVAVRVRSREWEPFVELMRAPPGSDIYRGRIGVMAELVVSALPLAPHLPPLDGRSPAREISVVYIGECDEAAHYHGTGSTEYAEASRVAGALVNRIASTLDFEQDSLVVLSDHGHRPPGGHGGTEPDVTSAFLLARGGLLRQGVELREVRPLRDVASTLSILAGLPTPSSNLGRPMLDLFALDDAEASFVLAAPFDQAAHYLCRLSPTARCAEVEPLVERLKRPDPAAGDEAERLLDALTEARDRAFDARSEQGARERAAILALLLAIAAAAGWLYGRRFGEKALAKDAADPRSWALPFVNAGVYAALLYAAGYRPTFSTMKAAQYFIVDALPPALAAMVAVAVVARFSRPGRFAPWILLLATAIPFSLLVAWVGWEPALLPPPVLGILVFELSPAVISAAFGAVLVALIAR